MRKRRTNMGWIPDRRMRHITFSKRRKGLFKKAQQLCRLTGATVGIVCFNEVGNPFTFVYPPLANANGNDGENVHQRLLSIMKQHHGHSGRKLPPVAVEESKSFSEEIISRDLPQPAAAMTTLEHRSSMVVVL
uniref:MADS-box domain-containing protein n=1 Tax=Nymphaea colorata TaxID=210225 RepID=A0A5K1AX15_9MAGN